MADEEQKQNVVSDDSSCLTVTVSEAQVVSKLAAIETGEFIYAETATSVANDNGHDILQQALNEAENVTESVIDAEPTQVQESRVQTEVISEAQNLLNTLTGEVVKVDESESPKDNGDAESIPNVQTSEISVNDNNEICSIPPIANEKNLNETEVVTQNIQPVALKHPLGSSQNPIKIILEGSKFHPPQNLTSEQFQQITQFIQGQQIEKIRESGGSSVVYNASTNTKIIYKVVSPQEALSKTSLLNNQSGVSLLQNSVSSPTTNNAESVAPPKRGRGRPRKDGSAPVASGRGRGRGRRSSSRSEEPDMANEPLALTKEELEIRKKHRPRTRSGRISKPPSYMVKEYKRIHLLDYHDNEDDIADKPDGGYSDYEITDSDEEKSNISSNPPNDEGNEEQPKSTEDGKEEEEEEPKKKPVKHRGRPPLSDAERSTKRKNKLRDAMTGCSDEEVVEVVKGHLKLSAWDFILGRCMDDSKINVYEVYRLFDDAFTNFQNHFRNNLLPSSDNTSENEGIINITDKNFGEMLGASTGKFSLSKQIKFHDLETCTKRPREDEETNIDERPSKKLKLNWSGRYSASGVDLSISEIGDEPETTKSQDDHPSNVKIIKPDQMQVVSIAPVQVEEENQDDVQLKEETDKAKNNEARANIISDVELAVAELHAPDKDELTNEVNGSDQPSEEITLVEQPEEKLMSANSETNDAKEDEAAEVAQESTGVPMEDETSKTEGTVQSVTEEVSQQIITEGGDSEEAVTLLIDPDASNDGISTEQTLVRVIDDGSEACDTTTVSTENLLGYLGQQLSAEALQPGNIVIIQNGDGTTTTVALSSSEEKEIPMETVQALLAMDQSAHQQMQ